MTAITTIRLLTLLLGLTVMSMPALAHAKLKTSSPAANAKVSAALKVIQLEFSEAISPDLSKFELDDSKGTAVFTVSGKDLCVKTKCKLPIPALAAGPYTLKYHVLSADDGHVVDGKFSFSITG